MIKSDILCPPEAEAVPGCQNHCWQQGGSPIFYHLPCVVKVLGNKFHCPRGRGMCASGPQFTIDHPSAAQIGKYGRKPATVVRDKSGLFFLGIVVVKNRNVCIQANLLFFPDGGKLMAHFHLQAKLGAALNNAFFKLRRTHVFKSLSENLRR